MRVNTCILVGGLFFRPAWNSLCRYLGGNVICLCMFLYTQPLRRGCSVSSFHLYTTTCIAKARSGFTMNMFFFLIPILSIVLSYCENFVLKIEHLFLTFWLEIWLPLLYVFIICGFFSHRELAYVLMLTYRRIFILDNGKMASKGLEQSKISSK